MSKKVFLTEQVSTILQHHLPTKFKDLGAPTRVMVLYFGNMIVGLNVFDSSQQPSRDEDWYALDIIDGLVEEPLPQILVEDPLERCLTFFDSDAFDIDGSIEEVNSFIDCSSTVDFQSWKARAEPFSTLTSTPAPPSLEVSPKLELKPLPATLKYVFLGLNDTLHVIS